MANSTPEWAARYIPTPRPNPFELDEKTKLMITNGIRKPTEFECILTTSFQSTYRSRLPKKADEPLITLEKLCQAKIMQRLICEIYNYPVDDIEQNHPRRKLSMVSSFRAMVHPLDYVTETEFDYICQAYQSVLIRCPEITESFPTLNDDNRFLPIKLRR